MGNGVVENFNKTMKNMLKKVAAERPKDWHRYLTPLMFAVRDTPQDSTGFTPFELLYKRSVRTSMTILKNYGQGRLKTNVSTCYWPERERIEETCALAKEQLAETQKKNQKYYNRRSRNRELQQGDLVLLLLPTERNKLTLSWRGPFTVVGKVGNVDYKVKMVSGKVKIFHINMLTNYYQREATDDKKQNKSTRVQHQAAAIARVFKNENDETNSTAAVKDSDLMPLYNVIQKKNVNNVVINPELSAEQINEVKMLLKEYSDIFTDVPKITRLAKHRVYLT